MLYRFLKISRVAIALIFIIATASIFNDIYEWIPERYLKGILFLQFIPSLLKFIEIASLSVIGFAVIILVTLLFGRIYCSTICPLGIMQDIISWIAKKRSKRSLFFKTKIGYPIWRYSFLALTIASLAAGFALIVTLLDPYSQAGRIFNYVLNPIIVTLNNGVAFIAQKLNIYSIYKVSYLEFSLPIILITFGSLGLIGYMAYKRGRLFCNTICPVGTFLGLISKVSWFKIKLNPSNCTKCAKCIGVCKSECINLKTFKVDTSRCVDCFNCLTVCNDNAIHFKPQFLKNPSITSNLKNTKPGRREAILTLASLAVGSKLLAASDKLKNDSNFKKLIQIKKNSPISPPGSKSVERFNSICTGCGLCISACPTKVLQPATIQYGLIGFMQPHLDYSVGNCNLGCTNCGSICPTGAILEVTNEQKETLQLGKVVFVKDNCIVFTEGTDCGACSEHCPTKAVDMVAYKDELMIPEVNQDICIGCGACEHPCPLPPKYKAIYVDGNPVHLAAKKPEKTEQQEVIQEDFPF